MKIYPWQEDAMKKIDEMFQTEKHSLMAMNACVGSGKTAMGAYAFGKFITLHRNEKTISVFVAPRINLCNQQDVEIRNMIDGFFGLKAEADKDKKADYKIWLINCESNDSFKNANDKLYADHNVFVICDESLWGTDPKCDIPDLRYNRWIKRFTKWEEEGFKFGAIVYDEAHNYMNKVEKMVTEKIVY